jgi:hypothetical protein
VKPYAVMWNNHVDATVQANIGDFLQAVTNSDYLDWLTEYDTFIAANAGSHSGSPGTQQLIGRGAFDPTSSFYVITPSHTSASLTDAQIQAELEAQISSGQLPVPDNNTLFAVFFPPGISINSGGAYSCVQWCAYHSTYQRLSGQSVPYAIIPDFNPTTDGGAADCSIGCGPSTGGIMELVGSAASHEMMESITDTDTGLTALVDYPMGWYDTANGEIADPCANNAQVTSPLSANSYYVQQIFSSVVGGCISHRTNTQDFKIWFNPNEATVVAGSSAGVQVPLNTAVTAGAPGALTLAVSGLPANVTGTLDVSTVNPDAGATLTLLGTDAGVASSDAVVVTTATSTVTAASHSAAVLLQVIVPPDEFGLTVPALVQLVQGGSQQVSLTTAVLRGSAGQVTLSVPQLPTGVTQTALSPDPVAAGSGSTLTLSAGAGAPVGTYPVEVVATAPVGAPYASSVTTQHLATFSLEIDAFDAGVGAGVDAGSGTDAGIGGDAGVPPPTSDGGTGVDAGVSPPAPDGGTGHLTAQKGCGCAADGAGSFDVALVLALASLGLSTLKRVRTGRS